jgi:HSP20 family molecular chaperone IbpA
VPLIRFRDPSRDLTDLQTQMNQIFDHALGQSAGMMDRSWAPPADMGETPDELIVYVDLPGLSEKDIRVAITGDLLMIQGERPLREPNQEASPTAGSGGSGSSSEPSRCPSRSRPDGYGRRIGMAC